MTAHLSVDRGEALAQLDAVLGLIAGPCLIIGDLNLPPEVVVGPAGAAGFAMADPGVPTFPAAAPRARIDHVLARGVVIKSVTVLGRGPVSDHLPVSVEVGDTDRPGGAAILDGESLGLPPTGEGP